MTVEQFNSAVEQIQEKYPTIELGERFTSTIGGVVNLHQSFDEDKLGFETPDFEFFNNLGLTLSHEHFFTIDPIEGVESEYAQWDMPTFIQVSESIIEPDEVKNLSTKKGIVKYNSTMCAWKLPTKDGWEIGYKKFLGGGFGLSIHNEFINWLEITKQTPWSKE